MPRIPAAIAVVLLVATCIGLNIARFPVVFEMTAVPAATGETKAAGASNVPDPADRGVLVGAAHSGVKSPSSPWSNYQENPAGDGEELGSGGQGSAADRDQRPPVLASIAPASPYRRTEADMGDETDRGGQDEPYGREMKRHGREKRAGRATSIEDASDYPGDDSVADGSSTDWEPWGTDNAGDPDPAGDPDRAWDDHDQPDPEPNKNSNWPHREPLAAAPTERYGHEPEAYADPTGVPVLEAHQHAGHLALVPVVEEEGAFRPNSEFGATPGRADRPIGRQENGAPDGRGERQEGVIPLPPVDESVAPPTLGPMPDGSIPLYPSTASA